MVDAPIPAHEYFAYPSKLEFRDQAIAICHRGIAEIEMSTLADIVSTDSLNLYSLAKRSRQREVYSSQLLKLQYPETYALIAQSLTGATEIPTSERSSFHSNMDWFNRYARRMDIFTGLLAEEDYIFQARVASESSYAMRVASSDELSKRLGLASKLEDGGEDFGVFEARLNELNENLIQKPEDATRLRELLVKELSGNTLKYHDIVGAQVYATSVWAFDKILTRILSLPGAWAMHKEGINGQETGNRVVTLDDARKGYGSAVLESLTNSKSPLPVYSSMHLTFPDDRQLLHEVRMRFLDSEQFLLRTDMANSRAIRKGGILNIGLSHTEVSSLTENSRVAAENLKHTSGLTIVQSDEGKLVRKFS